MMADEKIFERSIEEATLELGVQAIKSKQHDAILSYLSGSDTLVVLPTGYGKSLIYAVLPLVYNKLRGRPINSRL